MPPCHYVAKSVKARGEHREFFATGVDFDHGGVEQNRQGGAQGVGGCFYSLTVRICQSTS
jgi:hypothetical protein